MMSTFQPADFVTMAFILLKVDCEVPAAKYRAAISRAYYGAFLAAREHAGITEKSGKVHSDVIDHYGATGIKNRLTQLRLIRNEADYNLNVEINRIDAEKHVGMARRVVEDLAGLKKKNPK